jgi:hypothetical protein
LRSSSGEKQTATAVAVANEVTGKVEESPPRTMGKEVKNTFYVIQGIALAHNESLCDGHPEVWSTLRIFRAEAFD